MEDSLPSFLHITSYYHSEVASFSPRNVLNKQNINDHLKWCTCKRHKFCKEDLSLMLFPFVMCFNANKHPVSKKCSEVGHKCEVGNQSTRFWLACTGFKWFKLSAQGVYDVMPFCYGFSLNVLMLYHFDILITSP